MLSLWATSNSVEYCSEFEPSIADIYDRGFGALLKAARWCEPAVIADEAEYYERYEQAYQVALCDELQRPYPEWNPTLGPLDVDTVTDLLRGFRWLTTTRPWDEVQ
ncbi:hypothetical protein [Streptomyces sp. NPDC056661]|uniref:hypothetical protein n=1 Tax=Streptomyces sp. NPDC056661 TaxID=3345898 RepID=UPI0036B6D885